jgi:acyl-CoA synthetase (AMP-forming)/AMP-acid ligase II/acyl carrier protein
LQFAPITFDASTFEIWGSLLNGGKLVLCSPGLPSFEELGRMIEVEKITILWLSAGLFHEMVEQKLPSLQGLRFLLAGGDTLSVSHVLKANCELSRCELINGYGPTENTTFSCCYRISKDWKGGCSVPIGRPISNSQAYILDPYLHPVPIGVVGELFVGGDGLARGYLNRPELTAEKFIANPFKEMGGSLMLYRTGDMVRWLADGNIEFLGRADDQVKIRGFRVEPAEVEAILKQHDEVESASVILTRGKDHQKSLTACVVPRKGCPISKEALRLHAERRLPAYMVPAHFLIIDRFPLTPNGKVDRRALLQLSAAEDQPESVRIFTSPRTGSEKQLANIWEELLGRRGISINDNFFHLGGNSLLAMQVISRVATVFRIELPVRVLFETPTIAGVAEAIAEFRSQPVRATLIQPIPRNRAADLLARLDALSEPELELLLEETESKTVSS